MDKMTTGLPFFCTYLVLLKTKNLQNFGEIRTNKGANEGVGATYMRQSHCSCMALVL
jgi:hypothetical protein